MRFAFYIVIFCFVNFINAQTKLCGFSYFKEINKNGKKSLSKKEVIKKLPKSEINLALYSDYRIESLNEKGNFFYLKLRAEKKDSLYHFVYFGKNKCFEKVNYSEVISVKTLVKDKPILLNKFSVKIDTLIGVYIIKYHINPVNIYEWEMKNKMEFTKPEEVKKRDTIIVLKP